MSEAARISCEGVDVEYAERAALRGISFSLPPATLTVVLGSNGSGKTTLLRAIAGLIRPTTGVVRVLGDDVQGLERPVIARRIALVPQRSGLAIGFTVREVVAMGRVPHQARRIVVTATDREAVEGAIDACELSALAGRAIESLSGGEQQRVHVARALAQQTPVLLLDEAAAHLDLRHTTQLFELVRREITARRLTCVAALHDLATAGRFADMALLLGEGRLIAAGTVDDVMTRAKLEEAFATALRCGKTPEGDRYFVPV